MNKNLSYLLSGAIALSISSLPATSVQAQTATLDSSPTQWGTDLKLSSQQRKTIESISDIAFDQMDTLLSSGFDPKKIDRTQLETRSDSIQKLFTSLRLDDQQTNSLRTILKKARDQIKRGMETSK